MGKRSQSVPISHARECALQCRRHALFKGVFLVISMTWIVAAHSKSMVSPLCAATIKEFEALVSPGPSKGRPLAPKLKKKFDQEVAQSVVRQVCDRPGFAIHNSLYVAELHRQRPELARVYRTLLGRLHGAARAQLMQDQARWEIYHVREYQNPGNDINTYHARIGWLRELLRELAIGPYPFVSDKVIIRHKSFKDGGGMQIDAHYPQFGNHGADAAETNRFFARSAREAAQAMETSASRVFAGGKPIRAFTFEYDQSVRLSRPGPDLLDVSLSTSRYTGGTESRYSRANHLIDLRTDAIVPLKRVFAPNINWRRSLSDIVHADLAKQWPKSTRNGFEAGPTYLFGSHELEAVFNTSVGAMTVNIPYSQLRPLLRVGGPLAVASRAVPGNTPSTMGAAVGAHGMPARSGANGNRCLVHKAGGNAGQPGAARVVRACARGTETVLYSFTGSTGLDSWGRLVIGGAGALYGTTGRGGARDDGTVFKVDARGRETVLHSFGRSATDGTVPVDLVMESPGTFYGITILGGAKGGGTVFKPGPGGKKSSLYSFGGTASDGKTPEGVLVERGAGNLFGTTMKGGANGDGTVFRFNLGSHAETVLYSFAGGVSDGQHPQAGLVMDSAGNLYGTTSSGGSHGDGAVFKIKLTAPRGR